MFKVCFDRDARPLLPAEPLVAAQHRRELVARGRRLGALRGIGVRFGHAVPPGGMTIWTSIKVNTRLPYRNTGTGCSGESKRGLPVGFLRRCGGCAEDAQL